MRETADNVRPVVKEGKTRRRVKGKGSFSTLSNIKSSTGIVVPEVKKVLLAKHQNQVERTRHRLDVIFPSEMAKADWCPRSTYYRMIGRPEPPSSFSFTLENVFSEGNRIHEKWQNWFVQTGKLWGTWKCAKCDERHIGTNPAGYCTFGATFGFPSLHDWKYGEVALKSTSLPVQGRADGAFIDHNCLIEIKSVGIGTLRFEAPQLIKENTFETTTGKKVLDIEGAWKNLHRPLLSHVRQGNIYLWMAEQMGLPFDRMVFLYEFKANQQTKEFTIKKSQDTLQPMLDMAQIIAYAVAEGVPPACPKGGCAACKAYEEE